MDHTEFENITIQLHKKTIKSHVNMAMSSIVGTRQYQQDSMYGEILSGNEAFAIVCDGMGGLNGGEIASQTAIIALLDQYAKRSRKQNIPLFFNQAAKKADETVASLKDEDGKLLSAGTTIVAAIVRDGQLYWLSVGDSKISFIRDQKMVALNREHNYRLQLDSMRENGEISEEKYEKEMEHGEALISYLGIGNLQLMDINIQPFSLQGKDKILLCSDGLYKCLSEQEIMQTVIQEDDIEKAVAELIRQVETSGVRHIDNTSIVMMSYNL